MKSGRLIGVLVALLLVAASCSSDSSDEETDGASATETAESEVAETDEAEDEAETDAAFPRTITHSLGTTELTEEPQVVVPLFGEILGEQLLALGIEPAGALPYMSPLPADGETYGLEALYDVEPIGAGFEPNLELIAALEPDLIISDDQFFAGVYDQLSEIAPTVALDIFTDDWQANFRTVAEFVGREEQAEEVIADYEARVEEISPDVAAFFGDEPVAVVQGVLDNEQSATGGAGARIYGADTNPGRFLADLGITVWEPADPGGSEIAPSTFEVSAEVIPTIDAGAILYLIEPERFSDPESVEADALWQSTAAAENEQFHFLDFGTQVRLGGPLHKFIALDAVAALVAGEETGGVTPAPVAEEEAASGGGNSVVDVGADAGATQIGQFLSFSPAAAEAVAGDGPITLFLVSDAGLGASQTDNPDFAAALRADFELLDQVLQYHVVDGALAAEEIIAAGQIDTLLGEPITVTVEGDAVVLNGGQATVTMADLTADNGISHVIDNILVPPSRAAEFGGG
ncbi:MAG: ABC transporter substrate-binding protein [Actinomycetota bacterium]